MAKKNDFNQEEYIDKVDSAHTQIKGLEDRVKAIENITTEGTVLAIFKKDATLREEFEKLIWWTIVKKSWIAILVLCGSVVIIPIFSKIFSYIMLHIFSVTI